MWNYKSLYLQGPGDGTLNRGRRRAAGGQTTEKGQVTDDIIAQHPELTAQQHQLHTTAEGGGGSDVDKNSIEVTPPGAEDKEGSSAHSQGDYCYAARFTIVVCSAPHPCLVHIHFRHTPEPKG